MGQRTNIFKTNFSSGEVSPSMYGRLDVTRHKNGAAELQNFIVRPQGGIIRRTGTEYLHETYDSANPTRLIPFQFSNIQSYVLEFGQFVIRVIKNKQLILDGGSPLEIPCIYDSADLAGIKYAQSADVIFLTHPDYPPQKLSRISDTNWVIEDAPFEDGPYRVTRYEDSQTTVWLTSIVHRANVTSTDAEFTVADLNKHIEFWKDGNLIIGQITNIIDANTVEVNPKENVVDMATLDLAAVIDINGAGTKLRSSLSIWSSEVEYHYIKVAGTWYYMTTHDPIPTIVGTSPNSYPSDNMNLGTAPVMKTTTGVLTFSSEVINATLNASSAIFTPVQDVGRHFRLNLGSRVVWGKITLAGTTICAVRLGTRVPKDRRNALLNLNNATTANWRIGAWYGGNYPRCVTIHQGRLMFAGTYLEPNRGWLSASDDFVSFAPTNLFAEVLDSSSINFGIGSGEVNTISWLQSGPVLLVGTIGEEFQVKPSSISEPLTPSNINITAQTPYGSKENIRPIKIGPSTLFIQRHGQRVRELTYSFEIDSFTAADTTIVSEHIFRSHGSAVDMSYQQTPNSLVWFICSDGKIVTLTYEKDQQVFAWSNSFLGGDGFIESITSIPSSDNTQDDIYFVVRRTVDGNVVRYIEVLSSDFYPSSKTDKDGMVYLDCCKRYTGAATTTITGLGHLEGETVSVLANFAVHPDVVVTGGSITLQYAASNVLVGYSYQSKLKTLSEEGGSQIGTAHGKLKKIVRVDAHLLDSIGLKYGRSETDLYEPVSFRETTGNMGESPDLFSGFVELTDDSGFNKDGQFYIVQDQPYPLNILALMPIIVVNE